MKQISQNKKTFFKNSVALVVAILVAFSAVGCGENKNDASSGNDSASAAENATEEGLSFSYPQTDTLNVCSDSLEFRGSTDVGSKLVLNGKEQNIGCDDGIFAIKVSLKKGENIFIFKSGKDTKRFVVTYETPLLQSYTPSEKELTLDAASYFTVTATALAGSSVTAEFCGSSTKLEPEKSAEFDGKTYCKYTATVNVPEKADSSLMPLLIKATGGGHSQTVTATHIKTEEFIADDETAELLPLAKSKKQNYILTVTSRSVETFDGNKVDDYSRPTNSYLPKGTVDSCSPYRIYDSESKKKYYLLSSGIRVYSKKGVKISKGTVKKNTTVTAKGAGNVGNQYQIRLKMSRKSPFRVTLKPQSYNNTKIQDYNIKKVTYSYVDIQFFKCNKIKGKLSLGNCKLFKKGKWIKKKQGYILRLYLRKQGAFYGYDSFYNKNGELVLSFLNPVTITKTSANKFGYSLNGIKIMIDAGHGGADGGASNITGKGKSEKYYSLLYANELSKQLKKLGATVVMTRTSDATVSLPKRFDKIANAYPDLTVAVHFNSSVSSSPRGYFCGYYYPFTYTAANTINQGINSSKLLKREKTGVNWHYFNLSRVSVCPVVLTENGYLSNRADYNKIKSSSHRKKYVESMVRGIVNYFASTGTVKNSRVIVSSRIVQSSSYQSSIVSDKTTSSNPDNFPASSSSTKNMILSNTSTVTSAGKK